MNAGAAASAARVLRHGRTLGRHARGVARETRCATSSRRSNWRGSVANACWRAGIDLTTRTTGWASMGPIEALRRIPPLFANNWRHALRLLRGAARSDRARRFRRVQSAAREDAAACSATGVRSCIFFRPARGSTVRGRRARSRAARRRSRRSNTNATSTRRSVCRSRTSAIRSSRSCRRAPATRARAAGRRNDRALAGQPPRRDRAPRRAARRRMQAHPRRAPERALRDRRGRRRGGGGDSAAVARALLRRNRDRARRARGASTSPTPPRSHRERRCSKPPCAKCRRSRCTSSRRRRSRSRDAFGTDPTLRSRTCLLDRAVVPECLQDDATPRTAGQRNSNHCSPIPRRSCARSRAVRAALGPPDALQRCARICGTTGANVNEPLRIYHTSDLHDRRGFAPRLRALRAARARAALRLRRFAARKSDGLPSARADRGRDRRRRV